MGKWFIMGISSLLGLGLLGMVEPSPASPDGPPPSKEKKKKDEAKKGGEGELRKAYDLIRRVKSDLPPGGRSEERLRDWSDRAARLYRRALDAHRAGEEREARELALAAHDLARTVDHAGNAAKLDRHDPDLPPPPGPGGPEDSSERARRDLKRAHERISELRDDHSGPEETFYFDAARDLYNAARQDIAAHRDDRGGELARAAEAITHVPEHLAQAADRGPEPKEKRKPDREAGEPEKRPRPKDGPPPRDVKGDDLPPPID